MTARRPLLVASHVDCTTLLSHRMLEICAQPHEREHWEFPGHCAAPALCPQCAVRIQSTALERTWSACGHSRVERRLRALPLLSLVNLCGPTTHRVRSTQGRHTQHAHWPCTACVLALEVICTCSRDMSVGAVTNFGTHLHTTTGEFPMEGLGMTDTMIPHTMMIKAYE